jgi:hypothetical protein
MSGVRLRDVTSGFRAISRDAALRLNVLGDFTYTLESIIQAGHQRIPVVSILTSSRPTRQSRLFSTEFEYVRRTVPAILRVYLIYQPLKTFSILAALAMIPGIIVGLRFVYFYASGSGAGHIQSLILAAVLLLVGFQTLVLGLLADLLGANRRLVEDSLYRVRRLELVDGGAPELRAGGAADLSMDRPPSDRLATETDRDNHGRDGGG